METRIGEPNAVAMGFFFAFIAITLGITYWAARRTKTTEQFYVAGRSVSAGVTPRTIQGRPAWFRVFYAVGKTYPCWWHPLTHVYAPVTTQEEHRHELSPLHDITRRIASLCRLDWFTTEIALTLEDFVAVDYVNDQIDTRVQSKTVDGATDEVIRSVAQELVKIARKYA